MSKEKTNYYGEFLHWLADAGLYSPFRVDSAGVMALAVLIDKKSINIDCFCPSCADATVFKKHIAEKLLPEPMMTSRLQVTPKHNTYQSFLNNVLTDMTFNCARDFGHTLRFILALDFDGEGGCAITKIGQLPSKLDLVRADIRKYSKLAPDDAKELNSAAVCASVGFHVAAFVYLRRVFERRLEIAHEAAKGDEGWDESAYDPKNMRMEDRIAALKDHLPEFLVENRKIYGLLSKGVHELTEDECADAYKTLEVGITLILDEEIERERKAVKLASVAQDLEKLQQKHNS